MVSSLLKTVVESVLKCTPLTDTDVIGLSPYEMIRMENIREKNEMFNNLFPEKRIPAKKTVNKSTVRTISIQTRRSSRISVASDPSTSSTDSSQNDVVTVRGDYRDIEDKAAQNTCEAGDGAGVIKTKEVVERSPENDGVGDNLQESLNNIDQMKEPKVTSREFQCQLCGFKSGHNHSLKRHIVKKHQSLDEMIPCPRKFCSLSFSTRSEKEIHVNQCWLMCPRVECNKKIFSRPDKFQQHIRMHKRMDEKMD